MRVASRVAMGGHAVPDDVLYRRFPKTRTAISHALSVVDAAVLVDNSRDQEHASQYAVFRWGQKCFTIGAQMLRLPRHKPSSNG
jgi:predicted ABC-type ATPase